MDHYVAGCIATISACCVTLHRPAMLFSIAQASHMNGSIIYRDSVSEEHNLCEVWTSHSGQKA
ncbi:hypothetical protein [Terrimonas sp.]|uniref:hypothetical protein n=1 Tax=Terrimonas sp. TaxID=1914338 RepID=UPI001057248C|nr:hypothetical protein [Terrimonas sp.]